jgi:arylsulfatase A-like enzyme
VNVLKNGLPIVEPFINQTLGHLLSAKGYECVYAGKWHLSKISIDENQGFKKIHNFGDIGLAESCVDYLKQNPKKPFFMVASFDNPHNICEYARKQSLPWVEITDPPIEDCPNLPKNFFPAPFEPDLIRNEKKRNYNAYPTENYTYEDWRRYLNAYYRLVEHVDKEIGKIIDALATYGLEKNTVVIFSSDHGDGCGSHQWNQKSALFEEVINIPLIVRFPDRNNAGTVLPQLVNNGPDFFASVCDWAKIRMPDQCLGKSFRKLVEGESQEELHKYLVTETAFDTSGTAGWAVRTPEYKYVLYPAGRYREQLFDMVTDKEEQINLAVEAKFKQTLEYHRQLLKEWGTAYRDTRLSKAILNINSRSK